jgi:hypothetical protein
LQFCEFNFFGRKPTVYMQWNLWFFGHWNISVHNLHEQWCFVWKHFVIIWKKKHGKSLENFVYIVWIRLIWAILLGKFLNFNITKLKQKTAVHEQCFGWGKISPLVD